MSRKLTLQLDDNIFNSAKIYAQKNNTSLSQIIQSFLKLVTQQENNTKVYPPITSDLLGIIRIAKKSNYSDDYTNYLSEKYKWKMYLLIQI